MGATEWGGRAQQRWWWCREEEKKRRRRRRETRRKKKKCFKTIIDENDEQVFCCCAPIAPFSFFIAFWLARLFGSMICEWAPSDGMWSKCAEPFVPFAHHISLSPSLMESPAAPAQKASAFIFKLCLSENGPRRGTRWMGDEVDLMISFLHKKNKNILGDR